MRPARVRLSYLPQVVEVVLVVNPPVTGGQAVGLVGDVLHVEAHAVVELPLEELRRQKHTGGGQTGAGLDSCLCGLMLTAGAEGSKQMFTWTPRMPKMMKKAQQIRTMLPMGLRDVMSVSTTSFSPGALLITLERETETERDRRR